MDPRRGCLNLISGMLALFSVLMLAACSTGSFVEPRTLTAREIAGSYNSDSAVGALGRLRLTLVRLDQTRVYNAVLSGEDTETFGTSEGIGTLADDHLVLNFDRGLDTDFYFEGDVIPSTGNFINIRGQFIFPDQTEQLQVDFNLAPGVSNPG